MTQVLFRDALRAIRKTASRFVSIVIIVALGVGFYTGLKAVSPDMKATAENFYNLHNMADLTVSSTIGFDEEDLAAVRALPGVRTAQLTRSVDALLYTKDFKTVAQGMTGTPYVMRVFGYDFAYMTDTKNDYLNRLELKFGRLPTAPNECVVSVHKNTLLSDQNAWAYQIGRQFLLRGDHENLTDTLQNEYFTVVGVAYDTDFLSVELGSSTAGGGLLSGYIFVPSSNFKTTYYSTLLVRMQHSASAPAYSDAYNTAVRNLRDTLEADAPTIVGARATRLQNYYQPQVDDGEAKLAKGKEQLQALKTAVNQGPQTIAAERKKYEAQIARAKQDYANGKQTYLNSMQSYNANKATYDAALEEVEQHPNALAEYEAASNKLEQAENSYEVANLAVKAGQSAVRVAKQAMNSGDPQRIQDALKILSKYFPLTENDITVEGISANIEAAEADLNEQAAALQDGANEIAANKKKLKDAEQQIAKLKDFQKLEKALLAAKTKLDAARAELDTAPAQIAAAEQRLATEMAKAEQQLADAKARVPDAEAEVANAERRIRRAKAQMSALPNAQWIVNHRDAFAGYTNYGDTADNMQAFAVVFPVLFFLIAALVSLTTMARMVEDERTQQGVLKAVGYSSSAIAFKYLFYACTAGLLGSAIGSAVGLTVVPLAIFHGYQILYLIPTMRPLFRPHIPVVLLGTGAALVSTMGAVVFSIASALRHRPAQLMRPKAPKAGKRVFLEYVPFVWRHLGFNGKVTVRNLMRNKKRMTMTFVGITGCTALLLTGLGIGNSIGTMLEKQFGPQSIMSFDGQALLQSSLRAQDHEAMQVFDLEGIRHKMPVLMKTMYAGTDNERLEGHQIEVTLAVPQDVTQMPHFVRLLDEQTGQELPMTDDGVFINGKTAEVLHLRVGDEIVVQSGTQQARLPIAGIVRNYVYHYVYATPTVYAKAFGVAEPSFNLVLLRLDDALSVTTGSAEARAKAMEKRTQLSRDLSDTAEVITVVYNQAVIDSVGEMVDVLRNVVVMVFTLASGALAFVVLYNLNTINIYERVRELATIKVLGFYNKEADMFIYRENVILTLFGIAAGLLLGVPIHSYVIRKAEIESMMFVRLLSPLNFAMAAGITALFALLVNALAHRKIKAISMVESLKSVE